MTEFLIICGIAFIGIVVVLILIMLCHAIRVLVDKLKRRHYLKHRFDKPPTAECYCIDCKYHDDETKRCWRFGETTKEYRCTADNWFCWEATPRDNLKVSHKKHSPL